MYKKNPIIMHMLPHYRTKTMVARGETVKCYTILISCLVNSMVLGNEMCDQTPHPSQCNTLVIQHPA